MPWHQDCLVITTLLGSVFGGKDFRRLLKRGGFLEASQAEKPEALLTSLHAVCHNSQDLIGVVAKELNAKFRSTVFKARNLTSAQLLEQAENSAWAVPWLWASFQHPSSDARIAGKQIAHGLIYQGLRRLRTEPAGVAEEKRSERAEALSRQNLELKERVTELEREKEALEKRLEALVQRPSPQACQVCASAGNQEQAASASGRELRSLRRLLADTRKDQEQLRQQVMMWKGMALRGGADKQASPPRSAPCLQTADGKREESCPRDCPAQARCQDSGACPLRGRKIAVIGGIERMESQYCETIRKLGGDCLYHSGKTRGGVQSLRSLVSKSDLVVCITNVNSHGAMNAVKEQCKRCQKRFCPLDGVGVSALENLLRDMAV